LQDIPLSEYQAISPLIQEDVYHDLDAKVAVERRHSLGGTGFDQIRKELQRAQAQLATYQSGTTD
jgi:argininosuccinate lyase